MSAVSIRRLDALQLQVPSIVGISFPDVSAWHEKVALLCCVDGGVGAEDVKINEDQHDRNQG